MKNILILLILFATWSCKKQDVNDTPDSITSNEVYKIDNINPMNAIEGEKIIITGIGFSEKANENIISFGGVTAITDSASKTRLVTKVPAGAKSGKISVTIKGIKLEHSKEFTVKPTPSSFDPKLLPKIYVLDDNALELSSVISTQGGSNITNHGFVYSKLSVSNEPKYDSDSKIELGPISNESFPYNFVAELHHLTENTEYVIRPFSVNKSGVAYGEKIIIKTEKSITDKDEPLTVFFGGFDGILYAINAKTGEKKWQFATSEEIESSPTISDGILYFGSSDFKFYALNVETGKLIWEYKSTGGSITSSPIVYNDTVYFGDWGGQFHALDAKTGSLKWIFRVGVRITSSPSIFNDLVYTSSKGTVFYALDTKTGKEIWNYSAISAFQSSSTIRYGNLYVGNDYEGLFAFDAFTGKKKWLFKEAGSISGSPTVVDSTVYILSKDFYAIDAFSGNKKWSINIGGGIYSPIIFNKIAYTAASNSRVIAIDLVNRKIIWTFTGSEAFWSEVTFAGESIFAGTEKMLYSIDSKTGKKNWEFIINTAIRSSPCVLMKSGKVRHSGISGIQR